MEMKMEMEMEMALLVFGKRDEWKNGRSDVA